MTLSCFMAASALLVRQCRSLWRRLLASLRSSGWLWNKLEFLPGLGQRC